MEDVITIRNWEELETWCDEKNSQGKFVFRGQADSSWPLRTSLSRHFLKSTIRSTEWRSRELKMYRMFRERILSLCPGMYDDWVPLDILSLMQHHGTPTRLLDFTYSPFVASYFALHDARGDSAVWVLDAEYLNTMHASKDVEPYSGPTHIKTYQRAQKKPGAAVLQPPSMHLRLAAQRGCFLVPGTISSNIHEKFIFRKIILSENLVMDSLTKLRGRGIDEEYLFPDLVKVAEETNRFSVTGNANFPSD